MFNFPHEVQVALYGVAILIFADVALGIVMSISKKVFDVRVLPSFLQQNVLPYLGGLIILALASDASPEMQALFFTSAAAASVKFLADFKDKLFRIFGRQNS